MSSWHFKFRLLTSTYSVCLVTRRVIDSDNGQPATWRAIHNLAGKEGNTNRPTGDGNIHSWRFMAVETEIRSENPFIGENKNLRRIVQSVL